MFSSPVPIFHGENSLKSVLLQPPPHLVRKDGGVARWGPETHLRRLVCLGACARRGDKAPSSFTDLAFSPWGPPGLGEWAKGIKNELGGCQVGV